MRINVTNIKSNYNSTPTTQNFSFKSVNQIYKIKRAMLNEPESKAIYEKATDILNKIPYSKMEKTIIKEIGGKKFGIRWNTTDPNKLLLKIKDNIETSDSIEWDKSKDEQSVLECVFDAKGIIRSGTITKKLKNNYSLNAIYTRNNNHKTILIDGITYRPCVGTEEYWTSMPSLSCYGIKKDINLLDTLKKIELAELFCNLIKKNTTIK